MDSAATTVQEETQSWRHVRTDGAILELLKWHFNIFLFSWWLPFSSSFLSCDILGLWFVSGRFNPLPNHSLLDDVHYLKGKVLLGDVFISVNVEGNANGQLCTSRDEVLSVGQETAVYWWIRTLWGKHFSSFIQIQTDEWHENVATSNEKNREQQ